MPMGVYAGAAQRRTRNARDGLYRGGGRDLTLDVRQGRRYAAAYDIGVVAVERRARQAGFERDARALVQRSFRSTDGGHCMPEKKTLERAAKDKRQGKAPSTQAGEFVREEMDHVREGKHGARSTKQAIAIGLSKARRAGVALPPPKAGTHRQNARSRQAGRRIRHTPRRCGVTCTIACCVEGLETRTARGGVTTRARKPRQNGSAETYGERTVGSRGTSGRDERRRRSLRSSSQGGANARA